MTNVLDKYRKVQRELPKIETLEGQPYEPFGVATGLQRRLDLRPGSDTQRIVPYSYITEIFYAGDFMIDLLFHGYPMHVAIRGEHLGELIGNLREERIIFIAEFIPEWHKPVAEGQPIIQTLTITKPGRDVTKPAKH
jgi:hypothetical protein